MKYTIWCLIILFITASVQAVDVEKTVSKLNVNLGEEIDIKITVKNNDSTPLYDVKVLDLIDSTMFSLIYYGNGTYNESGLTYDAISWNFEVIQPNEVKRIGYSLKLEWGISGIYNFPKTRVIVGKKIYFSNSPYINIKGLKPRMVCVVDGACKGEENYLTCPQDCPSGGEDDYCDGVKDGICDPDCVKLGMAEKDQDCRKRRPITVLYIFLTVLIVVLVFFIYRRTRQL